jgi:hypothetical protein
MSCEQIYQNHDLSEAVSQRNTLTKDGDKTHIQQDVFACIEKQFTVEQFKSHLVSLSKAVKFDQFEREE